MVWLHTMRAAARLELRPLGRDMWRELARGFPYVEESVEEWSMLTDDTLDMSRATEFPKGYPARTRVTLTDTVSGGLEGSHLD